MQERPLTYRAKRFALGTNCALLAMPDACASYLMSMDNFVQHVTKPGTLLLKDDAPEEGDAWCHYVREVREVAWMDIVKLEAKEE